ncbi:MAG: type IV pilus modification protein PilV [Wenzhouxiangellaceae bacterium]|nr:type IV pilus modification protein PilV [Wenzhouxiangellaceae bacterium]
MMIFANQYPHDRNPRSSGFSLIEVLIALLVLSIGLVGMASLHLTSLKSAHSSYYRSLASTAALNIEEFLWQTAKEELDSEGDCITDAMLDDIAGQVQQTWRPGGSSTFDWSATDTVSESAGIPELAITFGTLGSENVARPDDDNDGTWTDAWRQVPVTLTWKENRLGDANTDGEFVESFDYTVRIACVPLFAPNLP